MTVLYHLVLDSISAFQLRPKTHMRSALLCRSLNNSVWFRFDWNVQHYFISIRKTFIDIFVASTELQKKNYCTHLPQKNTKNFIFAWKTTQNFLCTKKTTQNFTCMWPEHSTIASSWMLKCNASPVVAVAEKMWISQNMLFYLLAAACQDGSAWNERKKLQHFYQPVVNMVWDYWKSYARTFRCLALLRWERARGKSAMRTILGSNFILSWTLNLHPYVLLGSSKNSHAAITELLLCRKSTGVILRDAFPALQRLCANGPFEVLWLKITPTCWSMKDKDEWQKNTPPALPDELKKTLVQTISKDEHCTTFYAWISVITPSITNRYCCVLWGRGHYKLGTLVRIKGFMTNYGAQ